MIPVPEIGLSGGKTVDPGAAPKDPFTAFGFDLDPVLPHRLPVLRANLQMS